MKRRFVYGKPRFLTCSFSTSETQNRVYTIESEISQCQSSTLSDLVFAVAFHVAFPFAFAVDVAVAVAFAFAVVFASASVFAVAFAFAAAAAAVAVAAVAAACGGPAVWVCWLHSKSLTASDAPNYVAGPPMLLLAALWCYPNTIAATAFAAAAACCG